MTEPQKGAEPRRPAAVRKAWHNPFITALGETSNVTAAAKRAGIGLSCVYKHRREDPEFARRWLFALCEGYDNLEMDVLCRLRSGRTSDEHGNKFDNATAIRLLAAHRANAARARALRDEDDEQAVLDSIDAMIDSMRSRDAAGAALLAQADDEMRHDGE